MKTRKPAARRKLAPNEGAPSDHPGGGYYEAAKAYGDALELIRQWYPRRAELVAGCRAEGVSARRISVLLGLSERHVHRLNQEFERLVAEYDRRAEAGGEVIVQ